jgi:ABC-2 type transport system ATP-binding protein
VASGPVAEVLSGGRAAELTVRLEDVAAGLRALEQAGIPAREHDGRLLVPLPSDRASDVTRALAERGLYLSELRVEEADLETVFLELTEGEAK